MIFPSFPSFPSFWRKRRQWVRHLTSSCSEVVERESEKRDMPNETTQHEMYKTPRQIDWHEWMNDFQSRESNESDLLSGLFDWREFSHFPCEEFRVEDLRKGRQLNDPLPFSSLLSPSLPFFSPSGHKEWSFSQQAYLFLLTLSSLSFLFFFCYCQSLSLFAMSLSLDRRYTDNTGIRREERRERGIKNNLMDGEGERGRLNRRLSNDLTRFAGSLTVLHCSGLNEIEGVEQGREGREEKRREMKWGNSEYVSMWVCECEGRRTHTLLLSSSILSAILASTGRVWMWMSVDG